MESNPRPPLGHETAAQTLSSVMDRGVAGHADVDDDDVGAGVYNDVELKDILNGKKLMLDCHTTNGLHEREKKTSFKTLTIIVS